MPSLFIRGLSEEACERIRTATSLRDWTLARYLEALVELHETMRREEQAGLFGVFATLKTLGLQSIKKEG